MKKKKQLIVFLLSILITVAFSSLTVIAEAVNNDILLKNNIPNTVTPSGGMIDVINYISDTEMNDLIEIAEINQKILDSEDFNPTIVWAESLSNNSSSNYYRTQMSTAQQKLYDEIVDYCNKLLVSDNDLTDLKQFSSGTKYYPFSRFNYGNIMTESEASDVIVAAYYSNPQFYFLIQTGVAGSDIVLCANYDCGSAANRHKYQAEIDKITNEWMSEINKLSSDLEKEWLIVRKLSDHITYNINAPHNQSILGALIDKECVCNGYTMATTYFFNLAGIECFGVKGGKGSNLHAWNIASINGIWYEVDTTWIDASDYKKTDYYNTEWFNRSRSSFLKNDDSRKCHTLESPHTKQGALYVPKCITDMFDECEHDFENGLLIVNEVPPCMMEGGYVYKYCDKCYMVNSTHFWSHNYIWKFDSKTHWQECEFDCETKSETEPHNFIDEVCSECGYRNSLYGDVNNDGYIDNVDLLLLRSYLSDTTLEYNKDFDINDDGFVDNLDLLLLRQILSGLTV